MDRDGTFSYVAGTNARIAMKKVIVYHLVDARGVNTRSAKITIDIDKPGIRRPSPLKKHPTKAKSAANAHWYASAGTSWLCFGAGFEIRSDSASCLRRRSGRSTRRRRGWPSLADHSRHGVCEIRRHWRRRGRMRRGVTPGTLFHAADKQIIRLAANEGACLIFRQTLDRTPRHPRAGEWSKREFQTDSYVPRGTSLAAGLRGSGDSPCPAPATTRRSWCRGTASSSEPDRRAAAHCCFEAGVASRTTVPGGSARNGDRPQLDTVSP